MGCIEGCAEWEGGEETTEGGPLLFSDADPERCARADAVADTCEGVCVCPSCRGETGIAAIEAL